VGVYVGRWCHVTIAVQLLLLLQVLHQQNDCMKMLGSGHREHSTNTWDLKYGEHRVALWLLDVMGQVL